MCHTQIGSVILITYLFPYHVAQACARLLGLPRFHGSINTGIPSVPADTSIMNQSISMEDSLINQSIFTDSPHDQPSLLTEDHTLAPEDRQHFQNEVQYDYTAEGSSSLAVPYDPHSREEGAQEPNPDSSATDQDDLDPEDGTGNYMDRAADLHSYFTVVREKRFLE